MRLVRSPSALNRLEAVASEFAREHPAAASEWVEEVIRVVERLERFPASGRMVPEIQRETVREVIHGHYRILYHIGADQIDVLTVRHSRRLTGPDDVPMVP